MLVSFDLRLQFLLVLIFYSRLLVDNRAVASAIGSSHSSAYITNSSTDLLLSGKHLSVSYVYIHIQRRNDLIFARNVNDRIKYLVSFRMLTNVSFQFVSMKLKYTINLCRDIVTYRHNIVKCHSFALKYGPY